MSVIGHSPLAGASGAAGAAGDPVYIDDVFSTFLYTASGSTQTITNGIDLAGEGGMVWIKNRANGGSYTNHTVVDSERIGSYGHESLYPNLTEPEFNPTSTSNAVVTSFSSNGFTRGGNLNVSNSSGDYVSWTFRKQSKFFDVVTYSGTGSAQNISHSLGSVPGMIMIHCRDGTHDWEVYHRSTGATKSLHLNDADPEATDSTVWNNTTPTSSVFTVGTSSNVNQNGHGYVAYLFAHDEQEFGTNSDEAIIKCGSYTGSGSSGKFVNLGFEPQWVLIKRVSTGSNTNWWLADVMRGLPHGTADQFLFPNTSATESGGWQFINVNSTGFTLTTTDGNLNGSGIEYIYMAIRRPHKPPTAATEVFNPVNDVGSSSARKITAGNLVDLVINKSKTSSSYSWFFLDRLRGATGLNSTSEASESTNQVGSTTFDEMNGIYVAAADGWTSASPWGGPYAKYFFTRAPGFFDVVCYTGSGLPSGSTISHGLGVVPELLIAKRRNNGNAPWAVYSSVTGNGNYLRLNTTNASTSANLWLSTTPTSTQFFVNTNNAVGNDANDYVAYLFATLDGISKVGSYSGSSGNNVNVDCGFTAGARFLVIKRTDSTADWYVWDSASGIVSGDDPYLLFNSNAVQVTSTDYIDPLNAGFTVTSSAPAALNASGGTYLFLAIA